MSVLAWGDAEACAAALDLYFQEQTEHNHVCGKHVLG